MDQSVIERLRKFVLEHPDMAKSGFIKGLDPDTNKIVIMVNGEEKRITIDELENGHLNEEPKMQEIKEEPTVVQTPIIEDEILIDDPKEEVLETLDVTPQVQVEEKQIKTLKDMLEATNMKDEELVDKTLQTFAVNNDNGSISINKAISIITDNSRNNVISCVRDNTLMHEDLSKYDVVGKPLEPFVHASERVPLDKLIDDSFKNILVYTEVSRLKNKGYTEEQMRNAKERYTKDINERLKVLGLDKKEQQNNNIIDLNEKKEEKQMAMELKPDKNLAKAGFADILILTIIILIYIAIIVNLISKLQ